MADPRPYRERFIELYNQLQNEGGLTPDSAFAKARDMLGPDPDQPNLDPLLRAVATSEATRLGWKFLVLPRVAQYIGLIGGIGWGGAVLLKVFGAPEASDWLSGMLEHLSIPPPVFDALGAALGGAAGTVLAGKIGKAVAK
jgi:hypothetical protein